MVNAFGAQPLVPFLLVVCVGPSGNGFTKTEQKLDSALGSPQGQSLATR